MAWPGPGGTVWAAELLLWATAYLPLGDLIRGLGALRIDLLRTDDPIERVLLDFYIGGGIVYAVAALPVGAWDTGTSLVLWVLGAGGWVAFALWRRRTRRPEAPTDWGRLARWPQLVVIGSAIGLLALELTLAEAAPTGNTFDSSVLATFTGLTQLHHQLPGSFSPVAPQAILYPQGATAWLAAVPSGFDVPVARLALLVTPLFLALVPLAAYVWGRRWWKSDGAGVALALTFAVLASWTRLFFQGSNDFLFAFPLLLLLWAWIPIWTGPDPPPWGNALAFGLLAGYSAALNPVGAELLFPTLLLMAATAVPRFGGQVRRWASRWGGSLAIGLVPVIPSLAVAWAGGSSFALTPGALPPPATPGTITASSNLLGLLDPFLFQTDDVRLSPFPGLRLELAILLVAGLALLYVPGFLRRGSPGWERMRWFLPISFVLVGLLAAVGLDGGGVPGLSRVAAVTSPTEASLLLFTVFAAVAGLPLVRLFEWGADAAPAGEGGRASLLAASAIRRRPPSGDRSRAWLAGLLVAALLVPGVVVTATEVPEYGNEVYEEFGNVTAADFALLNWSTDHLPTGAVVLVAPGSVGEFLPGTRPDVRLVDPMAFVANNATYRSVVADLTAGILTGSDRGNLTTMGIQFILVTGPNNVLWAPFSPRPLLADPTEFSLLFHEGDAYVFQGPVPADPSPSP